jgi:hypothetical protein
VLIYIVIYEPDDSSLSPHDNHISYYFLFNDADSRNNLYKKIIVDVNLSIIEQ